jgi:hypothetical protein
VSASKDFLHLFRAKLVLRDMENVVVVPIKTGNDHLSLA